MKKLNYFNLRFAVIVALMFAFAACDKTETDLLLEEEAITQIRSVKTGQTDPCKMGESFLELYTKDHVDVGHVSIMNDGDYLYVTYFVDEGWNLKKTCLYIGTKEGIPLKDDGSPDKSKFPYKDKFDLPTTSFEYMIPIEEGDDCYVVLACAKVNNCDDRDCGECDGKATQLTLRYDGASGAQITVEQKKDNVVVFDDFVEANEEFTFVGTDKKGTLGTEIIVKVDGMINTKIHTSCSQPLYIGLVKGDFTIVDGYSRNGGQFCESDNPPGDDKDCGDCEGKITNLTMTYDGDTDALITVKQKKDNVIVFSETVEAGDEFSFVGTDKKGTLGTEIYLSVDKELNASIHTSCSEPIYIGMSVGDFTIVDGYSRNGGKLCRNNSEGSRTKHKKHRDYDNNDDDEEKCKDKMVWADGGMMFRDYFETRKWGYLGEYCLEDCELVIAFKSYMTEDWAVTSGGPGNIGFIAYYNFAPDYMGNKVYYNTDYLNSTTDMPVGNIIVTDIDNDGLWEVVVDNSYRPDLKFKLGDGDGLGAFLFVGTLEDYNTNFKLYPYKLWNDAEVETLIFELDF